MERVFRVNAPTVVSDIIDGEAVIVNLISGHYFSAGGVASVVWEWIGQGASDDAMVQTLATQYGLDVASVAAPVGTFLSELLAHELILEHPGATPVSSFEPPAGAGAAALPPEWSPPTLDVYADMQDLLVLDPIHDVADEGWPMPKQPNSSAA